MSATALKQRLREGLKAAIQAKATDEVRLLRTLIAALDNAEAVPAETGPYISRAFGDATAERPRRELDRDDVEALLAGEIEARLAAATDYDRQRRTEDAARLRAEAGLIERYRTR